jgi:hypothetical protein
LRDRIKMPILCIAYLTLTAVYTLVFSGSIWMDVFWACYKNLTLVACFYSLTKHREYSYLDNILLWPCIAISTTQCFMYALCPISTKVEIEENFTLFGKVVVGIEVTSIVVYLIFKTYGQRFKLGRYKG